MTFLSIIIAMVFLAFLIQAGNQFAVTCFVHTDYLAKQLQNQSREVLA